MMYGESTSATSRAEDHSAMQTLAPSSLSIVMIAINHARKKGHCQVQPLHVAAALLDPLIRSVALHNACLYSLKDPSHPLKCEALDLCFKVALERLPVISDPEKCKEQTMSNALAAALKRAHANERRGTPEQSLQPLLAVKTSTAHLTISILDDPSVSRVFREAGFSSTDVKAKMEETVAQAVLASPHPPAPLFDNPGAGLRRTPFSSVQERILPASVPPMFTNLDAHGRRLKYGLQDIPLPEAGRVTRQDAEVAAFAPQYSRLEQAPLFSRQADNSFRFGVKSHDAEVRKIVEVFLSPKKRNPVLLSDRRIGPVLKEFSQRLARGEVPLLRGVKLLELPFTSLSVGMLSPETVEQKLAKLRRDVDGSMPTGGAIVSLGDMQWLLEPSQSIAPLVLQQLQQLLSSNASNRLWLLATSSSEAFKGFQFNKNPSLDELALQPVELTCEPKDPAPAPRHGGAMAGWNGGAGLLSRLNNGGTAFAALKTNGAERAFLEPDLCAECNRSFQLECASLGIDGHAQSLDWGGRGGLASISAGTTQFQDFNGNKYWGRDPSRVKEEENHITRRVQDIRKACQLKCSALHSVSRSSMAGNLSRDQFTSPVSEMSSSSERDSRNGNPSLTPLSFTKSLPQRSETSTPSPRERLPLHARLAQESSSRFLYPARPFLAPANVDAEKVENGGQSHEGISSWRAKEGHADPALDHGNLRPDARQSNGLVGTDLVLGRAGLNTVESSATGAGSRGVQEGQQPMQINVLQRPDFVDLGKTVPNGGITLSLHSLNETLSKSVPWQKGVVGAVSAAVMRCRSGEGPKLGVHSRTNAWLMFLGPDAVGKREIAKALAKCVYGQEEHVILMMGWSPNTREKVFSGANILVTDTSGRKYSGNCPLERLAEAVHENPRSVVLLEDIDRADYFMRRNLLKARRTGKLQDSSGREVSLSNVIVVMTCDAGANLLNDRHPDSLAPGILGIHEDYFSSLSPLDFKVHVRSPRSEKLLHTSEHGSVSVVDCALEGRLEGSDDNGHGGSILIFGSQFAKRKTSDPGLSDEHKRLHELLPTPKRQKIGVTSPNTALSLDLNLSMDERLSCRISEIVEKELEGPEDVDTQVFQAAQERFPMEMFPLLDSTVIFKPFNMRALANLVFEKLEQAVEDAMPAVQIPVEIDRTLLQIVVFFAWQCFCKLDRFQVWIDSVLVKAISAALQESGHKSDSVLRLIAVERQNESLAASLALDFSDELLPKADET